jgi:hypothetical protein
MHRPTVRHLSMLDDDGELVTHPTTVFWANLISLECSAMDPNRFHISGGGD